MRRKTEMLRFARTFTVLLSLLLMLVDVPRGIAQTSDDGAPKSIQYNGQNYFVEQSPGGAALKITPQGTPVPIGIVNIRSGRITALDPNNYGTVKGVYDAYKASGATFAPPETPAARKMPSNLPDATPGAASGRPVTFLAGGGAVVHDPELKADVTFNADGTEATFARNSQGGLVGTVSQTITARFEGGDKPSSGGEKTGTILKSGAVAVLQSDNTHITSHVGTNGKDVWKVTQKTNGGKEATLFESGAYATASVYSPRVQDPGKTLGLSVLQNVKADRDAIEKAAETAKQAGQLAQIDFSGDRSQNARAVLDKAVSQ
jgi:hypothetical protein